MTFDAHNHLHDPRLHSIRDDVLAWMKSEAISAVVNGTAEADWPAVAALAARSRQAIPSFGLHPWKVPTRSPRWRENLIGFLDLHPHGGVGEIGLDRWVEGHNLDEQRECFEWQLRLAAERDLPATIHCVRAWGALRESLDRTPLPRRGFLLHACSAPAEMLPGLIKSGAYFSFPPYFLHERKHAERANFEALPLERILIETDAPDLAPPPERNQNPLPAAEGHPVNHPANLELSLSALAAIRGMSRDALRAQLAENFQRWFGSLHPADF